MTEAMPPPPAEVFDRVVAAFLPEPDVTEGTGFGTSPGLKTGGRIFSMLVRDELVVKLPEARCAELVAGGEAAALEMGRRRMREWIRVGEPDEARWRELAAEARAYVGG